MITIDFANLNPLEKSIHEKLLTQSKTTDAIRITEAARICDCSISKISKFVKKLGFSNYKQYLDFLYGRDLPESGHSDELKRISQFIDAFDVNKVDELLELISSHQKIVLFGYGPSLLCAQYFEYRLRTCSSKMIIAVSDEVSVASMVDKNTLLIILTVTGSFHSFEQVYLASRERGCEVAIVAEEYNTSLFNQCDKIFWLSKFQQPNYLLPYEKSRTVFFIFLEEVIQKMMANYRATATIGKV